MSEIVCGIGASHSTLMNTHWDQVDHLPGPHAFRAGLARARDELVTARPDAVVIIGSNHFRGVFLDLMPAFTVGVGDVNGAGEAGTPGGPLPTDRELARAIVDHLVIAGFDPAFSLRLTVDHGITHAVQYLMPASVAVVPVIVNMFAPPLPLLRRCYEFGQQVGAAICRDRRNQRVAVIASGGLSHQLPWPKWSEVKSEDDRFLVQAWLNGRTSWREYEVRRREMIRAAPARINAEFDDDFLSRICRGDLEDVLAMSDEQLESVAGNGAHEIRSWLAMAGAVAGLGDGVDGERLAYSPVAEWLTGMGIAVLRRRLSAVGR